MDRRANITTGDIFLETKVIFELVRLPCASSNLRVPTGGDGERCLHDLRFLSLMNTRVGFRTHDPYVSSLLLFPL